MSFNRKRSGSAQGYSLIEVLIAAFVLGTVTVAVTGVALLTTRSAVESERQNVAEALANEEVEVLRTYTYDEIEYSDEDPNGRVERSKTVTRNGQEYTVEGFIEEIDDPADGTGDIDFKKVLYKVSWQSNVSGSGQSTTSSTVVAATFFHDTGPQSCTPGSLTCPNPASDCDPGAPAGCEDEFGEFTIDCPATGVCPGSETPAFVECPENGECPEEPTPTPSTSPTPSPTPPNQECSFSAECNEAGGEACIGGKCQQAWCENFGHADGAKEVCDLGQGFGEACNDGIDNDGDGGADLLDPDCGAAIAWGQNGVDDDGDGLIDEADEFALFTPVGACSNTCPRVQEWQKLVPKNTANQCTQGTTCVAQSFWHPCVTECSDGIDNDGDGEIDGNDEECFDPSHWSEDNTATQCSNFLDDDGADGVDLADPSCSGPDDNDEFCPQGEQNSCQTRHACPEDSCCLHHVFGDPPGDCTDESKCCPAGEPICLNGDCWECTAAHEEKCRDTNPELCADPDFTEECECFGGECVQCTSSRHNINTSVDERCQGSFRPGTPERNYCNFGECVECVIDENCEETHGPPPAGFTRVCLNNACALEDVGDPECSDGEDNDGDGFFDFLGGDPGCDDEFDDDERGADVCDDGADNDGDGLADFPGDPGCVDASDNDELGGGICDNGVDDDGDGFIDLDDPGCDDAFDPSEKGALVCDNGADDDGDGPVDLDDPECADALDGSEEF